MAISSWNSVSILHCSYHHKFGKTICQLTFKVTESGPYCSVIQSDRTFDTWLSALTEQIQIFINFKCDTSTEHAFVNSMLYTL